VKVEIIIVWDVTPDSLIDAYRRFGETYCLLSSGYAEECVTFREDGGYIREHRQISTRLHGVIPEDTNLRIHRRESPKYVHRLRVFEDVVLRKTSGRRRDGGT
jgi:hypothetical protein